MRTASFILLAAGIYGMATVVVIAQPSGRSDGGARGEDPQDVLSFINRMLKFDANQDGELTKAEMTDTRLVPFFNSVDENRDGTVTKDELTAYHQKESKNHRGGPGRGGPPGPGGPGMGGPGMGGPGGPGMGGPGMGGPIGQVLPPPVRVMLKLSNGQQKKVDALQKLVDSRLDQILNDEQKLQLQQMRERDPVGPGGPGGFGGPPDGPGRREGLGGSENTRPRRPPE